MDGLKPIRETQKVIHLFVTSNKRWGTTNANVSSHYEEESFDTGGT